MRAKGAWIGCDQAVSARRAPRPASAAARRPRHPLYPHCRGGKGSGLGARTGDLTGKPLDLGRTGTKWQVSGPKWRVSRPVTCNERLGPLNPSAP
jgi:hypothetical protein